MPPCRSLPGSAGDGRVLRAPGPAARSCGPAGRRKRFLSGRAGKVFYALVGEEDDVRHVGNRSQGERKFSSSDSHFFLKPKKCESLEKKLEFSRIVHLSGCENVVFSCGRRGPPLSRRCPACVWRSGGILLEWDFFTNQPFPFSSVCKFRGAIGASRCVSFAA